MTSIAPLRLSERDGRGRRKGLVSLLRNIQCGVNVGPARWPRSPPNKGVSGILVPYARSAYYGLEEPSTRRSVRPFAGRAGRRRRPCSWEYGSCARLQPTQSQFVGEMHEG
ncbi:hypothetical protein DPEC_G00331650 [Dallia pectoralis]|uniref:Uncharacterized protein n=1 Tax=Dallia pectoralis TaxID=75939 RepID=A0ACC2F5V7_DALPE|nr:hypothetical protein DPEC_G00331650 [Dallia pectoralis]